MIDFWIHPAAVLIIGALLLPLVRGSRIVRNCFLILVPLIAFIDVLMMDKGTFGVIQFMDWSLTFGRVDRLSHVFGFIMTLMCMIGTLYGMNTKGIKEIFVAWLYVAGSLGAIYCGDYLVLFLFWELMAFASVFLVWFRGRKQSLSTGYRYLLVHTFGGLVLLAGIILRYQATGGDISFGPIGVDSPSLYTYLIMIGFILNAAVPPLHAWLPDAYGEATVAGSVFILPAWISSSLLVSLWHSMVLCMRFLKMIPGVFSPTTLSARSAIWWPVSVSALKWLLTVPAPMPLPIFSIKGCCSWAAVFEEHLMWAAFLLTLASAGTFLHTGLKVPYFIWFGKNNCSEETWEKAADPPVNMQIAMAVAAFFCIFIGCYTPFLYNLLPYPVHYHPYTAYHLSESMQILLFTALGFFLFVKKLEPEVVISLDMDWFYRKGSKRFMWVARNPIQAFDEAWSELYRIAGMVPLMKISRFWSWFDWHGIDGVVDGSARIFGFFSKKLSWVQNGQVARYLSFMAGGALVVLVWMVTR
jgi:multicomponent Na+:H+ antiporter subunit D